MLSVDSAPPVFTDYSRKVTPPASFRVNLILVTSDWISTIPDVQFHRIVVIVAFAARFELPHAFGQLFHMTEDSFERLRQCIIIRVWGRSHTLAILKDYLGWNAHDCRVVRNVMQHYRAGSDSAILAHGDVAQHLRPTPDH